MSSAVEPVQVLRHDHAWLSSRTGDDVAQQGPRDLLLQLAALRRGLVVAGARSIGERRRQSGAACAGSSPRSTSSSLRRARRSADSAWSAMPLRLSIRVRTG